MARTDNLTNFLTDVSNAVRIKTGKSELIPAANLDTAIESIEKGGDIEWAAVRLGTPTSVLFAATNSAMMGNYLYFNFTASSTPHRINIKTQTVSSFSVPPSPIPATWGCVNIGDDFYFSGGSKFNILTEKWTKFSSVSGINGVPILIGEDIYFVESTRMAKFNTVTQIGSTITLPRSALMSPLVVGDDIYFGSFGTADQPICKFNITTQIATLIDVPAGYWSEPIAVGENIYFFSRDALKTTSLLKLNIHNHSTQIIDLPNEMNAWGPILHNMNLYFTTAHTGTGLTTTIGKLDTRTDEVTFIDVPSWYWGLGVLLGDDIYMGRGNINSKIIGKFNTRTEEGIMIDVPDGGWGFPKRISDTVYFSNRSPYDSICVLMPVPISKEDN